MLAVMITAILTGWGLSGIGGLLIFGVLYLVLAVMNLFVDFSFVDRAERPGSMPTPSGSRAFMLLQSSDDGLPGPVRDLRRTHLGQTRGAPRRARPAARRPAVRWLRPPGRAG